MSSCESAHTLEGGGKVAAGPEAAHSHAAASRRSTSSGGTSTSMPWRNPRSTRAAAADGSGGVASDVAVVTSGVGGAAIAFIGSGRRQLLDRERCEVGSRIRRVEDLAVE